MAVSEVQDRLYGEGDINLKMTIGVEVLLGQRGIHAEEFGNRYES